MRLADYLVSHARSIFQRERVSTSLPTHLRKEIHRAQRRLLWTKPLPNPIHLLGYKISFMGEDLFRYLLDEVFSSAPYYFCSDTKSPLIFDCGSNIGMSILFFKKLYPDARIVAFEPDPFTFRTLSLNVEQNKLSNTQLYQGALGEQEGEIEFFRDESPTSSSLRMSTRRERHGGPCIKVPALRLSKFITSEIDLLKIDVEGVEDAVIRDLAATDTLRRVRRIHLEYHHHIDASVDKLSSLLGLMEEHRFGYQIRSEPQRWPAEGEFQDILIYFYRR